MSPRKTLPILFVVLVAIIVVSSLGMMEKDGINNIINKYYNVKTNAETIIYNITYNEYLENPDTPKKPIVSVSNDLTNIRLLDEEGKELYTQIKERIDRLSVYMITLTILLILLPISIILLIISFLHQVQEITAKH